MAAGVRLAPSRAAALRYDVVASPLGDVLIAASDAGIARLVIGDLDAEAALEELEATAGVRRDLRGLEPAKRQIRAYFARKLRRFDLRVDLSSVRGFARDALEATRRVPYGTVSTYGDVAADAGRPRAARAAGNALRGNPIALLVPCHRVVPASGGIGGYGGQESHKAFLLELESSGRATERPRREKMER